MIKIKTQLVFDWEESGSGIQIGDMYWVTIKSDDNTHTRERCILTKVMNNYLRFTQIMVDHVNGKLKTDEFEVTVEDIAAKKVEIIHYDYEFTNLTDEDEE